MWHSALNGVLAMAPPPEGYREDPRGQTIKMLLMMGFLFVIMYLLMIRPQQKKAKEHANMLKTLRRDDRVLTSGGVVGKVLNVKERTVTIRSDETKLEILKSAVTEILERGGSESKAS